MRATNAALMQGGLGRRKGRGRRVAGGRGRRGRKVAEGEGKGLKDSREAD